MTEEITENNKKHLPVINNNTNSLLTDFYTDKTHISFSELTIWEQCAYRHKLKYLDKIDLSKQNEYALIGSILHDGVEFYLKEKKMPDFEAMKEEFEKQVKEHNLKVKKEDFHDSIEPIITSIPKFLDDNFKDWEFIAAEDNLYESLNTHTTKSFKGFIDCIIKVPKSSRLKRAKPGEYEYFLIDWKNCSWGWTFDKKTDPKKMRQLVFYKHFYSKKYNIPLKDIKCAFVLLKRTPNKKTPNDRCELVPISVGEKRIEESLQLISKMLNSIKKKMYQKNRNECTYCEYKNTPHCT